MNAADAATSQRFLAAFYGRRPLQLIRLLDPDGELPVDRSHGGCRSWARGSAFSDAHSMLSNRETARSNCAAVNPTPSAVPSTITTAAAAVSTAAPAAVPAWMNVTSFGPEAALAAGRIGKRAKSGDGPAGLAGR